MLAFLDRINIGNAAVFGLVEDLNLTGDKYNVALTIFFVPYCIFEIPSNIFLKRFTPHVWLSINMFGFGFVTIMQGLVQNYGGLLVRMIKLASVDSRADMAINDQTTRFFLGLFETGMFPGCFYLIGM